jgi:hypothetical protein
MGMEKRNVVEDGRTPVKSEEQDPKKTKEKSASAKDKPEPKSILHAEELSRIHR